MKSFLMKLNGIQPSQLYINSEKLNAVVERITTGQQIEPIPVKKLGDYIVFVDGHTRALAAFLNGFSEVPVYWETEDMDWEAYGICVEWCRDEGISTIGDLQSRIVSKKEYDELWLDRCAKMQKELERNRSAGTPRQIPR